MHKKAPGFRPAPHDVRNNTCQSLHCGRGAFRAHSRSVEPREATSHGDGVYKQLKRAQMFPRILTRAATAAGAAKEEEEEEAAAGAEEEEGAKEEEGPA